VLSADIAAAATATRAGSSRRDILREDAPEDGPVNISAGGQLQAFHTEHATSIMASRKNSRNIAAGRRLCPFHLPMTAGVIASLYTYSSQGCRGYGDSHGDSHGYGYGMGMGTVMNPHGFCG